MSSENARPVFIGDYRVIRYKSEGGQGVVVEVEHIDFPGERLALKMPFQNWISRFETEYRIISGFNHPHICRVLDYGYEDLSDADSAFSRDSAVPALTGYRRPYFTMPLLGEPLSSAINPHRLISDRVAIDLLLKVASAISAIHEAGFLFCDVSPMNILLDASGSYNPCIVDFGLAMPLDSAGMSPPGEERQLMGNPHYASPEQYDRQKTLTFSSDVYSFGAVMYQVLTGTKPYAAKPISELLEAKKTLPVDPRLYRNDIDPDLATFCMGMLAYNPTERMQSMELVIERLTKIKKRVGIRSEIAKELSRPASEPKPLRIFIYDAEESYRILRSCELPYFRTLQIAMASIIGYFILFPAGG